RPANFAGENHPGLAQNEWSQRLGVSQREGRSDDGSAIAQDGISARRLNFKHNGEAAKEENENTLGENYEKPSHSAKRENHEENRSVSSVVCLSANGPRGVGFVGKLHLHRHRHWHR